jgi:hypothetical protein
MGYETYLVELLRPLGVYDLSEGTINREELAVYGVFLDQGEAHLEESEREMCLLTAEDLGLEQVEELLPYRPVSDTTDLRRAALAALLRIGGDSFTLEAVNDTLAGCGINAKAKEVETPNYVQVWFPDVAGVPEGFEQLKAIIEEILPCQLGIEYLFWYLTWGEAREKFASWGELAESGMSWQQLRVFVR